MKDESKSERQLIQELLELRTQIVKLEKEKGKREQIEEALRESEKRYKEVVESAAEIIHTTDIWGKFTFANTATLKAAGTSLEEFKQLNYLEIIHPDHRQRLSEIYINQFRERKATIYVEFPILSRSGEVIWLGQNSSLMFEGKKVVGFHSVARDITELKKMEETLRRSEKEAKRLAQENALVAEVGRIIGSTPNIDEVFERFSKAVAKLIPFDRVLINLRGLQEDDSFVRYVAGIDVPHRRAGEYVSLTGTATAECMRTKSSLLIQPKDEKETEEWAARFPKFLPNFEAGIRSAILVPLIAEDQIIGVLSLRTTKVKAYTDQDVRLTESIASQIAGAVANAQLFMERERAEKALQKSEEEARRLAKENEVIAEIGRIISSTLRIEEVYELFAKEAGKLIPLDRIAINVLNPEANRIISVYVSGVKVAGREAGDSYPLAGSISEGVMRTRKSLLIQTEDQDELAGYSHHLLSTFQAGFRSMLSVALISKDQVIGVMHIRAIKPNAYTEREVQLAERIGNQIAGAIANAQLFAELKRMEGEREKLIRDLQKALSEVKKLSGFLPICASCKKIRDDKGYWNQVEVYIRDRSEAEFSHGICPDCMKKLYGDFLKEEHN
ncbi:MAG: GAF domain-containing protein [Proteobacteria bacterium]|nr:GAF domain-containing protein [Pseudomonadota bacterium]